jgi:hypothetical protein
LVFKKELTHGNKAISEVFTRLANEVLWRWNGFEQKGKNHVAGERPPARWEGLPLSINVTVALHVAIFIIDIIVTIHVCKKLHAFF